MSAGAHLAFLPPATLADLQARYAESQRHYHTWDHIEELFARYEEFAAVLRDARAVALAIAFHDAVYDPMRSDNEPLSAALLKEAGGGEARASVAAAMEMIEATKSHTPPTGAACDLDDALLFLDADLSILGADQARFDEYEAQVRKEYAFAPGAAFTAGRAAILKRFLERPTLYFTDWGRRRFETQARANLRRSLSKVWA
ncbi:MAG: hypothetical protein JNJ73_03950 [Hyphomonadaceae bacterium]|nr:hypothetical protein [Hyphomonadaceae bacterium]